MEQSELEEIIAQASLGLITLSELNISHSLRTSLPDSICDLTYLTKLTSLFTPLSSLPENIGNLSELTILNLSENYLTDLPDSIGYLANLKVLDLGANKLTSIPDNIGYLCNLIELHLHENMLSVLPENINYLTRLNTLNIGKNQLTRYPDNFSNLSELKWLNLSENKISQLPESICNLSNLNWIELNGNPLTDLSILQSLSKLKYVYFLGVELPRRYWTKINDWKAEWLLDESNAEIRRIIIEQLGYQKICEELNTISIDTWREYTLLKIDDVQIVYERGIEIGREPMLLLKMTCPSTGHIHILRVPPEMTSAEDAITWVNHGIHPDEIAVQT